MSGLYNPKQLEDIAARHSGSNRGGPVGDPGGNGGGTHLSDQHRRELEKESGISPEVVAARGYETLDRRNDDQMRDRLRKLHMPSWSFKENWNFPGLLIPMFGPTGARCSAQWKPANYVTHDGKKLRYASVKGQESRLDVHPFNVAKIVDATEELWITEGVKKADALTSLGVCVIALAGVWNWRNHLRTLGDWEDVPLRGRTITVCYDADAREKPQVLNAMKRLRQWLVYKGAKKVWFLIVPSEANGKEIKGADDYLVAGGTLAELKTGRETKVPTAPDFADDTFSDAALAQTIADDVLGDQYIWVEGLNWLSWNSRQWVETSSAEVIETIRQYVRDRFADAAEANRNGNGSRQEIDGWRSMESRSRIKAVLELSQGIVERKAAELDADPDVVNTPNGVVDLATGDVMPHDPGLLITKMASGSYIKGYRHDDWEKALDALDKAEREYLQVRIGQGITGHTTPDGVMPVLQGSGENGKSLLTTDGVVPALGDYASMASTKLFKGNEHSEEMASLRGQRLLIAEELAEGRSIDVSAMKRIQDVGLITARHVYGRNVTFPASHSLLCTTNYVPIVSETDHGTWRRLALLKFPRTYRKPGEELLTPNDRHGDATLKARIRQNRDSQHDAIVTWAIEGAMRWYADPDTSLKLSDQVAEDTKAWRIEADRILGFWDERITADPDRCILTTELFDAFNAWLNSNSHNLWSKETFGPRFEQHGETVKHAVAKVQTRKLRGLDRYTRAMDPEPPRVARVYQGVRFQTDADREKQTPGTGTGEADGPHDGPACRTCARRLLVPRSVERRICESCYANGV